MGLVSTWIEQKRGKSLIVYMKVLTTCLKIQEDDGRAEGRSQVTTIKFYVNEVKKEVHPSK